MILVIMSARNYISVSILVGGRFRRCVHYYDKNLLVSDVLKEIFAAEDYKADDYEVHSIGQNRALDDYDDVVQEVVKFHGKDRPVTLGMLMEKRYASDCLELNFVWVG